jgi:hypothetical protein
MIRYHFMCMIGGSVRLIQNVDTLSFDEWSQSASVDPMSNEFVLYAQT